MPKKVTDTTGCPSQVLALVDHLRSLGTGAGKLDSIIGWGVECQANGTGAQGFMERIKALPPGTLAKLEAYLASVSTTKGTEVASVKAPSVEAPATIAASAEDKPTQTPTATNEPPILPQEPVEEKVEVKEKVEEKVEDKAPRRRR